MAQLVDHELTHAERVDAFRSAISQIRTAGLALIDVELFGASDEVGRCVFQLERQFRVFQETDDGLRASAGNSSLTVTPDDGSARPRALSVLAESRKEMLSQRKGRRVGIDIIPGSVKRARMDAGMSLAEVAGREVTRVAVWYVETGRCRPSLETLRLIAERTGRPVEFFTGAGSESAQ